MTHPEKYKQVIEDLPIVKTLGMHCDFHGDEMTAVLPFQDKLIGNPIIKALHGGAISTFLELTAMALLCERAKLQTAPRTINLTTDYLRQGRAEDAYARATITKLGRRMASVQAEAWQSSKQKPIATLLAHFKLPPLDDDAKA